jgi:hypothetical protein
VLLAADARQEEREAALIAWLGRSQPCLFGRLAARAWQGPGAAQGPGLDICWVLADDLARGHEHIAAKVWTARAAWKRRAVTGQSSAFLIVFNDERLAHALPGPRLDDLCLSLADTYLSEWAPVQCDTVYAEAVPLHQADGTLALFKAGTRLFRTGAHHRPQDDRRFPGGVAISVNAPGHYVHSLVARGLAPDLGAAMELVRESARAAAQESGRPLAAPATYRIDALLRQDAGGDPGPSLRLDRLTAREFSVRDPDHGWSHGLPVGDDALLTNPWDPVGPRHVPA